MCHVIDTPLSREQKSEMKQYPRIVQRDDGGWGLYVGGALGSGRSCKGKIKKEQSLQSPVERSFSSS